MSRLETQQRRGMRMAIVSQCLGSMSLLALQNNLLLLYLASNGVSSSRIVTYLALPLITDVLARLPMAYLSDRFGKKRIGLLGQGIQVAGYVLIVAGGWMPPPWSEGSIVTGLCLFSAGHGAFAAGWFALLSPIVPEAERGRFFGRLRYSWQTVGIVFTGLCAFWLAKESPVWQHQMILAVVSLGILGRIATYSRIPEIEAAGGERTNLRESIKAILHNDAYISFCAYLFLITLITAACPTFFGLVQKRVLELGDRQVAFLGMLLMVGAFCGFIIGGRLVDRYGTRLVFLLSHLGFGLTILGFVFRGALPMAPLYAAALFVFLFGATQAASSIAFSTEMLALIPPIGKSLSTSLGLVLARGGAGLMGVLAAWVLDSGLLSERWEMAGLTLSAYDSILMGFGILVVLLTVTLGLVPSVRGKSRWMPNA